MTAAASTAWTASLMSVAMPSTVSLNLRLKLSRDIGRRMGRNLQNGERLRPVDLARGHGLSTQAIRNYEEAGILPAADRTPHGYRTYTSLHAGALRAFLALVPGHGHRTATSIMRAVNQGAVDEAFRLIDESHAQLLDDRRTLQAVESALRDLEPTTASECHAVPGPGGAPGPMRVPVPATRSSGRWQESSGSGPRRCANGSAPGWCARAATR